MVISERVKYILFFLVVALVYGVTAQEVLYFFSDDTRLFFTNYDYPLFKFSGGHPHRLIDFFYQNLWTNFYFKYIQGVFIEPLFGQQHFLDTFRQMSFVSFGLCMAGLFFFSTLYVSVFVKLSFKQLAVFAALFYLLFIQHVTDPSINGIHAKFLTLIAGLAFLYPIFVYALKGRNIFSEWNEYKSAALMLILSYVACFSYFHTMMLISIGVLALAIIYLFENYKRSDFSSMDRFLIKIKTEPKWLLTIIASFPIFMGTSLLLALNSGRFIFIKERVINKDYVSSLAEYKLDKALILLAILFIIWAWNAYRNNTKINKGLYLRYGAMLSSLLLFVLSFESLNHYLEIAITTGFDYTRLIVAVIALGCGFKIMQQGWAIVPMYFLFFILAAGGVRALVSQESTSRAYYHYNVMKVVINLAYTFSCYGEERTPFYDKKHLRNKYLWRPITTNSHGKQQRYKQWYGQWYRQQWYRVLARYTRLPLSSKKGSELVFYFEPSIAKINSQLKVLRETKPWQCARVENDIYRIEKLPY